MKLPYRGILCVLGLIAAVLLLPQSRPFAQSSSPGSYATPNYSYGATPAPGGSPAPGYSSSMTTIQSGPVGSFTYSSYLNFKVPVSLTGHSFALKYLSGTNEATSSASVGGVITAPTGPGGAPNALYLAVTVPPPGSPFNQATTDWWLADTTGQLAPASAHKTFDLTNVPWTTFSGAPNRYFAIPDTRVAHGLYAGFPQGGWSPVISGPVFWTYGSSGSVSLRYFVGCAPAMGGNMDAYLFLSDRNTDEKSPWGKTDVRAAGDWTFDPGYTFYPTVPAHVTLEMRERGHYFTVHSQIAGAPEMQTSCVAQPAAGGANTAALDFQVGSGLQFWITRDAENGRPNRPVAPATGTWAAGTNPSQVINQSAVGRFPAPPLRQAALVPHQFRVNAATRPEHIFSVRMSDGYTTIFSDIPYLDVATNTQVPDCGYDTITQWNIAPLGLVPLSNPLPIVTFTAMIDPTRAILFRDNSIASGGGLAQDVVVDPAVNPTDIFDGWVPVNVPPPAPTITIRVPSSRLNHAFRLYDQPPNQPAAYPWPAAPQIYPWPSPLPPLETITYSGVGGMADYAFSYYTLTLANPTPYYGGPFTLQDTATLQPHDVSAGENDLRAWLNHESPVDLQISTSRMDHRLRVRHPNGEFFDITHPVAAGNQTLGSNRVLSEVSYYYFDATTHARAELPWYVEDLDTRERLAPGPGLTYPDNDALIMWIAVAPPHHLTATPSADKITLAWTPGDTATGGGFLIERREGMSFGGQFTPWHELKRTTVATYFDTQLVPGEYVYYRVRAFYGDGLAERRSAPSNIKRSVMWIKDGGGTYGPPPGDPPILPNEPTPTDPPGGEGGEGSYPGIPGDGDGNGNPDNDKDGVVDTNDSYPNDGKRSEDIPVKFYGVIDLSKATYSDGTPVKPLANATSLRIDDQNRVAWLSVDEVEVGRKKVIEDGTIKSNDPYTGDQYTMTTWHNGSADKVVAGVEERNRTVVLGSPGSESGSSRYLPLRRLGFNNGSTDAFGSISISEYEVSNGDLTQSSVVRGYPGEVRVPDSLLQQFTPPVLPPDDNTPYADDSFSKVAIDLWDRNGADSIGEISYVTGGTGPGVPRQQHHRVFRGDPAATSASENSAIVALSDSWQIALTARLPGDRSNIDETQVWLKSGGLTNIGRAYPNAINNDGWVVGNLFGQVQTSDTDPGHLVGWEDPEVIDSLTGEYGRGRLGFLWSPSGGKKTFHDLLPEKFRKQLRSAVPFLITNADPITTKPKITFNAESWEGEPADWVGRVFTLEWDSDGEALVKEVHTGERLDSSTGTTSRISVSYSATNSKGRYVGTATKPDTTTTVPVVVEEIQLLDRNKQPRPDQDFVISQWQDAWAGSSSDPYAAVSLKPDFISDLSDSIHIRMPNSPASGSTVPKVWLEVRGFRPGLTGERIIDDKTELKIVADSSLPGAAITEKTHILVTSEEDNAIASAHGNGPQDALGDRIHLAELKDTARVTIEDSFGIRHYPFAIPPKNKIRRVPVRVFILNDRPGGTNWAATDAEMQEMFRWMRRRLAQVNIIPELKKVEQLNSPVDLRQGLVFHGSGDVIGSTPQSESSYSSPDKNSIIEASNPGESLCIYIVNYFSIYSRAAEGPVRDSGFRGISEPPNVHGYRRNKITLAWDSIKAAGRETTTPAHELGHILSKGDHWESWPARINLMVIGLGNQSSRRFDGPVRLFRQQEEAMRQSELLQK